MFCHLHNGSKQKQSQRVPEMLGYLILILEAQIEYTGDGWLGYDRQFWMVMAGNPHNTMKLGILRKGQKLMI